MVLIEVRNSGGLVGRCDARCYNAKGGPCDCVCQGRNHGAGQLRAVENTRQMYQAVIERALAQDPASSISFNASATAGLLFDEAEAAAPSDCGRPAGEGTSQ